MNLCLRLLRLVLTVLVALPAFGETLVSFQTSVGNMELELFEKDKPETVANFLKYVTSGRFDGQFIQRWEANFVIQGGGYFVTNTGTKFEFQNVPIFGTVTNEYSVGQKYSNTYGTIAMARQSGGTNSATSQWFLNLTNNAFLDNIDGGFTVFGRVIGGTDVLNLFIPPPPTNGIYSVNLGAPLNTLPVLNPQPGYDDLIYVNVLVRKAVLPVDLSVHSTRPGQRLVGWTTVFGATNTLEYGSSLISGSWTPLTNVIGNGSPLSVIDTSPDIVRLYRVKVSYPNAN